VNFIILCLDDTPPDPGVGMTRLWARNDVVFLPNAMAQNPACKPIRAAMHTGQYSCVNGQLYNEVQAWTYPEANTVVSTARRAGIDYRFWGKYINQYGVESTPTYRPPGFRKFSGNNGGYQDPLLSVDGQRVQFPGYHADVAGVTVDQWLGEVTGPFIFWLSVAAPHEDTALQEAPARYAGAHAATVIQRRPSFNPPNSDPLWALEPTWIRTVRPDPFDQTAIDGYDAFHRRQYESLMAVDDLWDTIEASLAAHGHASDTAIMLVGDNSYAHMEHRTFAKESFYRECLETHLVVKWPGVAGRIEQGLCTDIDVSVTAVRAAGGSFAYPIDGVDLTQLITTGRPAHDTLFLEGHATLVSKRFYGVATLAWKYCIYGTGDEHLIDRVNDPYERHNLALDPAYTAHLVRMRSELAAIKPASAPNLTDPAPNTGGGGE
jgi:arylsulfatase A-like enzyme